MYAFCERLTADDAHVLPWNADEIKTCLIHLADADSWKFLVDRSFVASRSTPADICTWEKWFANLAETPPQHWTQWKPLPKSLTRHKILLHAFAGRRRQGDVEWYIDLLAKNNPGCIVSTVSIDIIIDPVHGILPTQPRVHDGCITFAKDM